jgi:hypothetical protein
MGTDGPTRERLAKWIVIWGLGATTLMAVTAIVCATRDPGAAKAAQNILTLALPVVGTWVGTVLAFYFARENFESAARETRLTLGGKLDKPAMEQAIQLKDIESIQLPAADGPEKLTLEAIRAKMVAIKRYRVPVFDEANRARYVVHQQPVDSFLTDNRSTLVPANGWTLKDLLDSKTYGGQLKNSVAVVGKDATMAQAKAAMEGRPQCQDVFLTQNGGAADPVVAWLTNNEIQRAATA